MAEKPILFSTPMIQALLNTKPGVWPAEPIDDSKPFKSQTRRAIKKKYIEIDGREVLLSGRPVYEPLGFMTVTGIKRPKYQPGDLLWVRETFIPWDNIASDIQQYIDQNGKKAPFIFKADYTPGHAKGWKPSIHMPRIASRIILEVKSVRIEQVQKIKPEDAVAEGAVKKPHYIRWGGEKCLAIHGRYKKDFEKLWDSINDKRGYSWEYNPWVWVYEFMRVKT